MIGIASSVREIARDVYQIVGFPPHMINMYLIGDVVVDAGVRGDLPRLLRVLQGRRITKHVVTHAHPDHQGASHGLCEALNIPLWCSEAEVEAIETGDLTRQAPSTPITRLLNRIWGGEKHPVAKALREGDRVADFVVLETPGHSPGHLSLWRECDRTLIAGDTVNSLRFPRVWAQLSEAPAMFTMNRFENRKSIRKLAELRPDKVLFGHGKPLLDGGIFVEFALNITMDSP